MNNKENRERQGYPNDHEEDMGDKDNDQHGKKTAKLELLI